MKRNLSNKKEVRNSDKVDKVGNDSIISVSD
jgi:hypothetical protein